jgi:hypothetical protein
MRCIIIATLALLLAHALGCSRSAKPTLMANMAKTEITVSQLRAIDYEYAARFGHAVAACVADIVVGTEDAEVVERAFRWRIWAMPQARSASFDQDPLAALIELWILASQQHQFFTVGNGSAWFGDQQERAKETTRQLQDKAEALMAETMSDDALIAIKEAKRGWVQTHPIEGELVARPTARADLASLVPPKQMGTLSAVQSMQETVGDMNDRITILTEQAPVEARWQAEYLITSLFDDNIHEDIETVVGSLRTMTEFLETFEETASTQSAAIFEGIKDERIMIFDAVERERAAILGAIENERAAILHALDAQLSTVTAEVDTVGRGLIDQATAELDTVGRGLVDHFFFRLIELLAVVSIAVLLVRLLVRRRHKTEAP